MIMTVCHSDTIVDGVLSYVLYTMSVYSTRAIKYYIVFCLLEKDGGIIFFSHCGLLVLKAPGQTEKNI